MENEPKIPQMERIELDHDNPVKRLDFKGLRVHYDANTETQDDLNKDHPAEFAVTPDTGGGESLSIWIWEGVPRKFKEILLHHELTEADLFYNQGVPKKEAHLAAYDSHMRYAKEFLNTQDYDEFIEWQNTIKISK